MGASREAEIVRQQPFRQAIKIISAKTLLGQHAASGESYFVIASNRKQYKLRYCYTLRKAKEIQKNITLFPKAFPTCYGREGRYLLFDWIDGTEISKDVTVDTAYQMGKLLGELHEANHVVEGKDPHITFDEALAVIETSDFDKKLFKKTKEVISKLRKKLKIDLILDIRDSNKRNYMIETKTGRVYYIDEEGMGRSIKGIGLDPILAHVFKGKSDLVAAFWKGYKEHHSNDYFDNNYQKVIKILNIIFLISWRIRGKRKVEDWQVKELEKATK